MEERDRNSTSLMGAKAQEATEETGSEDCRSHLQYQPASSHVSPPPPPLGITPERPEVLPAKFFSPLLNPHPPLTAVKTDLGNADRKHLQLIPPPPPFDYCWMDLL